MLRAAAPFLLALLLAASLARALPRSIIGLDRIWTLFGPADQGPVDFTRLTRRATPNDALACPANLCGAAKPDLVSPIWDIPYADLRDRLRRAIIATPGTEQVAEAASGRGDRFVVRTWLMRYPDTVDVMVLPLEGGKSTVAIYSRSLIGRSDIGANLARIKAWLADPAIAAGAKQAPPAP